MSDPTSKLHADIKRIAGLVPSRDHGSMELYCQWRYMIDFWAWSEAPRLTTIEAIRKMKDILSKSCDRRIDELLKYEEQGDE